jgi:nucleoside-diphosphate-sugar epimerase
MSQHVFMTGASGYIGSVVASFFIAQDYTVHALSRTPSSDAKLLALGATPIRGDLTSHTVLSREACKSDIVVHLADARLETPGDLEKGYAINNAAISALAEGIAGTDKKLILTSGTGFTAADPDGNETNEDSPSWPDSPFGSGMETLVPELKKKGINVNMVRLAPWVYGRGGSGVKLLMDGAARAGVVTYVEPGTKCTTTVHVDDAARLYLLVAQKATAGEIYNASSETNVTFRQLAEAMGAMLNVPVLGMSYDELEGKVGTFFAKFLSTENRASNAKAHKDLGWRIEAEKGILDEIASGSYVEVAQALRKA